MSDPAPTNLPTPEQVLALLNVAEFLKAKLGPSVFSPWLVGSVILNVVLGIAAARLYVPMPNLPVVQQPQVQPAPAPVTDCLPARNASVREWWAAKNSGQDTEWWPRGALPCYHFVGSGMASK